MSLNVFGQMCHPLPQYLDSKTVGAFAFRRWCMYKKIIVPEFSQQGFKTKTLYVISECRENSDETQRLASPVLHKHPYQRQKFSHSGVNNGSLTSYLDLLSNKLKNSAGFVLGSL